VAVHAWVLAGARDSASLGVDVEVILTPPRIVFYGESLMKSTWRCQNDFNVQGYSCTLAPTLWGRPVCGEESVFCLIP
jgi:hypothetical protein